MRAQRMLPVLAVVGASLGSMATAEAQTDVSLRLDWSLYGAHAPFYLGLEEGLYEKEGLNLTIGQGSGSATTSKLVAQGGDQFGFIDFSTLVRGIEQGLPVKAVMRIVSGVMVIVSHADAPIKSPKDLEGKVIAYAPAESTAQAIPALLEAENVDADKITVMNPAVGAKLALFLQGRADAIPANLNVQVPQIEAQGEDVYYFKYSDFGVDVLAQGIAVNLDFLKDNPDAVRAFLKATEEAFLMAKESPEKAVDALIKHVPEQKRNRSVLIRQLELTIPLLTTKSTEGKPFGWMSEKDWEQTQSLLVKYGGLPEKVDPERLYTNEYLPE